MIRIAYVIDKIETASAGTEKQLLLLLNNLDRSRFEPHLICLRESAWLHNNTLPVPVEALGLESLRSPSTLRLLYRFRQSCRENRIDIVQSFFRDASVFATLGARIAGVPVVVSSRRFFGASSWHTPAWLLLMRQLARMTDLCIANSRLIADYTIEAEHLSPDRMHVIYNGLDFAQFSAITPQLRSETRRKYGIADEQVLVGIVANIRAIKNHKLFVEAASRLKDRSIPARFIIVGDGNYRSQVESRIEELELSDSIILTGQLKETLPVLAAMDIGVLCSHSESLSNAIIEYMAAGLPCVVSDVGGNREAIGGEHGLVFADNDLDGLVGALNKLIADPLLRGRLGRGASEFARRTYELSASIERHERLYEQYFQKSRHKRR